MRQSIIINWRTLLFYFGTPAEILQTVSLEYLPYTVTCFRLMKGRAKFFRLEIIVASFLHLMVLFFKVSFIHVKI